MTAAKTKCSQCVNSKCLATEKPCNTCREIQTFLNAKEDNFLDASKNLMKE